MADDFISRWSRAKTIDKSIREQQTEVTAPVSNVIDPGEHTFVPPVRVDHPTEEGEVPPSLEDAKALTVGDDISRFMGVNVGEEIRSLALRKLFAMPHYNIRSDMDVYWEDYSNMPKLTAAEVANLQQSESLCLFKDPPWQKEMDEEARQLAAKSLGQTAPVEAEEGSPQAEPQEERSQQAVEHQRADEHPPAVADAPASPALAGMLPVEGEQVAGEGPLVQPDQKGSSAA